MKHVGVFFAGYRICRTESVYIPWKKTPIEKNATAEIGIEHMISRSINKHLMTEPSGCKDSAQICKGVSPV